MKAGVHEYLPSEAEAGTEKQAASGPAPFKVWRPSNFQAYTPPEGIDVLGTAILRQGDLSVLIGQGGLGKSSWVLGLAAAQIRGDSNFCGLPLDKRPRRWLFIGSENGAARWKADLAAVYSDATAEQAERLESHLGVAAIFEDSEPDLQLPDSEGRIRATIQAAEAEVVVLDPWAELLADEVDSGASKTAIRSIQRAAFAGERKPAALVIAHAKLGRECIADAVGDFGAANAMRGNRALFNRARSVMGLFPRGEDPAEGIILSHQKCNDGPRFTPRALFVDRDTLRYSTDPRFDVDAWREGLRSKSRTPKRTVSPSQVEAAVRAGSRTYGEITAALIDAAGCSERTAQAAIGEAVRDNVVMRCGRGEYALGPNSKHKPQRDAK